MEEEYLSTQEIEQILQAPGGSGYQVLNERPRDDAFYRRSTCFVVAGPHKKTLHQDPSSVKFKLGGENTKREEKRNMITTKYGNVFLRDGTVLGLLRQHTLHDAEGQALRSLYQFRPAGYERSPTKSSEQTGQNEEFADSLIDTQSASNSLQLVPSLLQEVNSILGGLRSQQETSCQLIVRLEKVKEVLHALTTTHSQLASSDSNPSMQI
eukprot:GILJ01010875.1.p1 GENE.GILJ01010875.1~~GILJ01010875.1.p1  ORF type:complete len:210 (+),score=21.14 GILJ01010875.1:91-720(+)